MALVMMTGDGSGVAFYGEYREIVPNERIVTTEVYEMPDEDPLPDEDLPLDIVNFTEVDGRTTLTLLVHTTSAPGSRVRPPLPPRQTHGTVPAGVHSYGITSV